MAWPWSIHANLLQPQHSMPGEICFQSCTNFQPCGVPLSHTHFLSISFSLSLFLPLSLSLSLSFFHFLPNNVHHDLWLTIFKSFVPFFFLFYFSKTVSLRVLFCFVLLVQCPTAMSPDCWAGFRHCGVLFFSESSVWTAATQLWKWNNRDKNNLPKLKIVSGRHPPSLPPAWPPGRFQSHLVTVWWWFLVCCPSWIISNWLWLRIGYLKVVIPTPQHLGQINPPSPFISSPSHLVTKNKSQ